MSLSLTQNASAISPGLMASFLAVGGTSPYVYSVDVGGAGGTIDGSTGVYTAPSSIPTNPSKAFDTIRVYDSASASATAVILIASPLLLVCDILQVQLGLANGRVYLWDQKVLQPNDAGLYVAVSVSSCKPFGSSVKLDSSGNSVASVNMQATLDINLISRDGSARDRKEEVILALISDYSQRQQTANSFYLAPLPMPARFINLSQVDGAAIPYRYQISIGMQYFVKKTAATQYFDNGFTPEVITNV